VSVVANVAINVDSRNAVGKLREVQSQASATERAIGGLGAVVGRLAGAFAAFQAAKFVFVQAAEVESQRRSLEVLTGSAQRAGQIVKELQDLGAVTPFTSSELIDAAKRLQAFGVETNKVVETTRRLADVSGATGAELQGLVTAYGQVQAKGRLQGEELLQFQERGVALQKVLREEYNLSGEEFQKALEGGRISAQAVEAAIIKLTDAGGKYANGAIAQSDTLNGRLSTLQDSIQVLAQTIGRTLAPVFQWALTQATAVVSEIQRILDEANNAGGARDREAQFARNADAAVRAMRLNPFTQQGMMADMRQRNIEQQRADYRLRQQQARTPSAPSVTTMPPLLGAAAGGGKGRGGKSDAEKAAREAEKLRQELERSLEVGDQLGTQFSRQVVLLDTASETERKRLQIQYDFEDRAKQIGELKNAEQRMNLTDLNNEIKRLETLKLQTDEIKKQLEEYYKRAGLKADEMLPGGAGAFRTDINLMPNTDEQQIAKYKEELQALTNPINMAITGANAIGDAFGAAFQDIATGAKSTEEALADAFKSIGSAFISMATEIIAKQMAMIIFQTILKALGGGGGGLFSGGGPVAMPGGAGFAEGFSLPSLLPGRANGGPVSSNQPYIVGERGPELFVPGTGGTVVNNNNLRDAMGNAPGARNGPMLNMTFQTTNIGGVEYVSRDQLEAAMVATRKAAANDGAKRGTAATLSKLQNSPSTRAKLGLR